MAAGGPRPGGSYRAAACGKPPPCCLDASPFTEALSEIGPLLSSTGFYLRPTPFQSRYVALTNTRRCRGGLLQAAAFAMSPMSSDTDLFTHLLVEEAEEVSVFVLYLFIILGLLPPRTTPVA